MIPCLFQKTIKNKIHFIGKGIHKNHINKITLYPQIENFGLRFQIQNTIIPSHYLYLDKTLFQISFKKNLHTIYTIEHLLFSLYILGIYNCLICFDQNNEVPIFDGSAYHFIQKILKVGIKQQKDLIPIYTLNKEITLKNEKSMIQFKPFQGIRIDYYFPIKNSTTNYFQFILPQNPNLWQNFQKKSISILSRARTFGYFEDWLSIKKLGYAHGANKKNTLILYREKNNNTGTKLRYPNEWLRHKILDFISSWNLIQYRILGHFIVYKSGHSLDTQFIEILDQEIQKDLNL